MYIDTYSSLCNIFRQVPMKSKVLEIGCGSGRLANLLTIKKRCEVYCIEKNPLMAGIARNKCKEMHIVDIENTELPFETGAFDCIIFVNVLEHLKEPFSVLVNLGKYLRDDGFVIYSVPNIVNWYSRLSILLGKFEYADGGVFEKTHLHFYTLKSAKKLASDSGYSIERLDVTPSIYLYKEKLNFFWYRLSVAWKNLFADEFIIRARKEVILK
jgi:SAM-dependent methyltransferase